MLVLTRKKHEALVINDSIVVTIVEVQGDRVRLGIQAPRDVPVHRGEVYQRIQQELAAHGNSWVDLSHPSGVV